MSKAVAGYRKLEEFEYEDGSKHDIRIHKDTGEFMAVVDGTRIEDSDLQELRKKMKEALKEKHSLDWQPVILINAPGWCRNEIMPVDYDRFFRAIKSNGESEWRKFRGMQPQEGKYIPEEECLEGHIGDKCYAHTDRGGSIIPYDPLKWQALRHIEAKFSELRDKLKDILLGEQRDLFLQHVQMKHSLLAYQPLTGDGWDNPASPCSKCGFIQGGEDGTTFRRMMPDGDGAWMCHPNDCDNPKGE